MADNYLENKYEEYLLKKKRWNKKKKHITKHTTTIKLERPEDEAL